MTWELGQPVSLETERCRLHSLTPDDADETYLSWWNDPEIQQGFNQPARQWNLEKARANISRFDNYNRFHLGIFDKQSGELIGFFTIAVDHANALSSANVCIGNRAYHRKGLTEEVAKALIDFRFRTLGMEKIMGKIMGKNEASINLYNKLGFTLEGVSRKCVRGLSGGREDIYYFGLLKEEWLAKGSGEDTKQRYKGTDE